MMFYVFVISQPVELKLDSEQRIFPDLIIIKNNNKTINIPSSAYAFVGSSTKSSTAVTHQATNRDFRCLTLHKKASHFNDEQFRPIKNETERN